MTYEYEYTSEEAYGRGCRPRPFQVVGGRANLVKEELKKRGSAYTGNKAQLASRLEEPSSNCVVCERIIKDQDSSNSGQDAIFCEGDCQGWLHRTCAGISEKAFNVATTSDHYHYCRCNLQEVEISLLKSTNYIRFKS